MSEIPAEVVNRGLALLRKLNTSECLQSEEMTCLFSDDIAELRAVLALLPQPVDPDMEEAHKVAEGRMFGAFVLRPGADFARDIFAYGADCIKRGRKLATPSVPKGWIDWYGMKGSEPINPDTIVQVKYRNGTVNGPRRADEFWWRHDGRSYDITAYRVVSQ